MKMKLFYFLIFLSVLTIGEGEKTNTKSKSGAKAKKDAAARDRLAKFDFVRKEPGNELGIFTKVIAQSYRKANQTTDEFSINREYMPKDFFDSMMERCGSNQDERPFEWRDCVSTKEGLFALVSGGVPEPKNKTITYLEVEFKPFEKVDENGEKKICVLDEVYKTKAYFVVKTFSHLPSNDTFPRGIVESVATVHQHQLDSFGKHFLSIFGDKIEQDDIYNFGEDEYYDRDPPYECFLSIGSSESTTVIQEKCDFFCPDVKKVPRDEVEKVLLKAKEEAAKRESKENDDDDHDHDEL